MDPGTQILKGPTSRLPAGTHSPTPPSLLPREPLWPVVLLLGPGPGREQRGIQRRHTRPASIPSPQPSKRRSNAFVNKCPFPPGRPRTTEYGATWLVSTPHQGQCGTPAHWLLHASPHLARPDVHATEITPNAKEAVCRNVNTDITYFSTDQIKLVVAFWFTK